MKYTIELTPKQKDTLECVLAIVRRYVGFNPKLEMDIPIPMKESPAYKKGFEDGKANATYNTELIDELKAKERQEGYDIGYTQAIADYRKFERFFNSVGIEAFEDIRNTDGTISIDMILQYLPMPEIMARIKAYEEKAEEIKVGDEVYLLDPNEKSVVTFVDKENRMLVILTIRGKYATLRISDAHKTGRHFDELEFLLNKLGDENND